MSGVEALGDQPTGIFDGPCTHISDLNFISVLGRGYSAKVLLVERKDSKNVFAIKVFKKEYLIVNDQVRGTKAEKNALIKATQEKHPFVAHLHEVFQTESRLCFVLEYVAGGDLQFHIQKENFSPERAQFYGAEVCLAMKFLHDNGILYRNTKLDKILLASDGHIKLIGFGLSKAGIGPGDRTSSFVGNTCFMAPEMLLEKPYGFTLDWWDFGVVIYQMVRSQAPFIGEDEDEIYDAILTDEPLYPADMPRTTVSFLQKLLAREPEHRLGSGLSDAEEVMKHEYFAGIDWDGLYHRIITAPFVPAITNDTDTTNFDLEYTSMTPMLTPVESFLTQSMQREFTSFSSNTDET